MSESWLEEVRPNSRNLINTQERRNSQKIEDNSNDGQSKNKKSV